MTSMQEIVMHLDTPSLPDAEDDESSKSAYELKEEVLDFVDDVLVARQPRLERGFEASADRARMAASSPEDEIEWKRLLAAIWGDTPDERDEIEISAPPRAVGYVHKLRFFLDGLKIAATDEVDKSSHLRFREQHEDVDLLWVPSTYLNPLSISVRVITHRSLVGHFEVVHSTPIAGWSRPPKWI